MNLAEIINLLKADVVTNFECNDIEVNSACGSDLMSDVMAYVKDSVLLLTGLVSPQVIRTAEMMDIKVVMLVRGKMPGQNIIDLANEKRIAVLVVKQPMFIACGMLYCSGLTGKGVWD